MRLIIVSLKGARSMRTRNVWDIRARLQENFSRVEALLREMEVSSEPKLRLAVAAEIRQHLSLAESTLRILTRAEQMKAFQETVLEALKSEAPDIYKRLADKIDELGNINEVLRNA